MLKIKIRVVLRDKRTENNETNGIKFPKLGWKWLSKELSALPKGLSLDQPMSGSSQSPVTISRESNALFWLLWYFAQVHIPT